MAKKHKVMIDVEGNEVDVKYIDPIIIQREKVIEKAFKKALKLEAQIQKTREEIGSIIEKYLTDIAGKHGATWKGNTTLKSFDESKIIDINLAKRIEFDERLQIAGEKINQWIQKNQDRITDEKAKESFEKVANIARRALKIDKKGKVDYQKIIQLKQFKFDDEEWKDAMLLIEDSMKVVSSKTYHKFKYKDDAGRIVTVRTNYSDF